MRLSLMGSARVTCSEPRLTSRFGYGSSVWPAAASAVHRSAAQPSNVGMCHFFAGPGAFLAGVGTLDQRVVARCHLLAFAGAGEAHFRAEAACLRMEIRIVEHEPCAGLANISAGKKHADVFRLGVLAAESKAVLNGFETDRVTWPGTPECSAAFPM